MSINSAVLYLLFSLTISPMKLNSWKEIYTIKNYIRLKKVYPDTSSYPEDSTHLFIGYTDKAVVFYAKNFQKGHINATIRKRDDQQIPQGEDALTFIIASSGIGKNAYYIAINPLGTIYDKILTPDGFVEWDGDITVKAHKTSYGWDCLLIVPFRSINFVKSAWGIQVIRTIISKNTMLALHFTKDLGSLYEMDELKIDFSSVKAVRLLTPIIIPEVRLHGVYDTTSLTWKTKLQGGGVVRLKGRGNTLFDFTYSPDYSELPLDFSQFSLQRLPVTYPEKRQFFIEGSGFYKTPVTLVRTRNIEDVKYGAKFYSSSKNNDFALFFVKDSVLKDIMFAKYTYHMGKNTSIGFFSGMNKINYEVASLDLNHYVQRYNTQIKIQGSRIINSGIDLKYVDIERNVNTGLGGYISYFDVDSGFVSPLNFGGLLDFDNKRKIAASLQYITSTSIRNKSAIFSFNLWGHNTWNKKDNSLIYKEYSVQGNMYYLPMVGALLFQTGDLNFLGLNDNSYKLFAPGIGYFISSWKQVIMYVLIGKYLGGNFLNPHLTLKVSPFGMNTGIDAYYVRSVLDSVGVINFYGEYRTPVSHLLLKPSVIYTNDFRQNTQDLDFNIVFVYEPGYLKGIYLAYQKSLEKISNRWNTLSGKIILKFKWGFKVM